MRRLTRQRAVVLAATALLVTGGGAAGAQLPRSAPRAPEAADTLGGTVIPLAGFLERVVAAHPDARIAALAAEQAADELFAARGAWEPTLKVGWDRKRAGGVEYYDDAVASLVVPTPLGADLKLGFERATGRYLNQERINLGDGQFTLGVSVPLTRGIVTDERRRRLEVARARREVADADRTVQLAELVREAARDYGAWLEASRREAIAEEGVRLATVRLDVVRAGWETGDLAGIDTIDARAELARRQALALEAAAALYAAERRVEARLWSGDGRPELLPPGWSPALTVPRLAAGGEDVEAIAREAARVHPVVRRARARIREASADRRFAAQRLLPGLSIDASALSPGRDIGALGTPNPIASDHKIGASLEIAPLLLAERGRFGAAGALEARAEVSAELAARLVAVRASIAVNDLRALGAAVELQRSVVRDTRALLDAERFRFEAGETSLLVLTLRERALLEEEGKLATLHAKIATAWGELAAAMGDPRSITRYAADGG